ncbi:MAG: trigger factor [Bacteroidota bacterium]|nr:trigger factor [Candidatus Kapabacteria bacterium]MDW8220187.1 trigger factor [Bacteroidota bacterium]
METQLTTLDGCKRQISITMSAIELEPYYEQAYREAQPTIQLAGFRKGKVPLHLIKKHFGKTLQAQATEQIANQAFARAVEEQGISVIGTPQLRDIQRHADGSLTLTIAYEVLPEFELQNYRNIEITKLVAPVTDEDIEREIEHLTIQQARLEDAEQITDDMHYVVIKRHPIDPATGMPLIGKQSEEVPVFLRNEPAGSELKASLLNLHVGDSFRYTVPSDNKEQPPQTFHVTVQSIKRVMPAEFSNEFVETITHGELTSTEEFRRAIEQRLHETRTRTISKLMDEQLIQKILQAHDFEPPQGLVHTVLSSMLERDVQKLPDKKLPKDFDIRSYVEARMPTAYQTAKWLLIRERIIEQENLNITEDDINERLDSIVAELNLPEANAEYVRSAIAGSKELQEQLLHEKLMEVLRGYAVITEQSVNSSVSTADTLIHNT